LPCPSAAVIYDCRDMFVVDLNAAISRIIDLCDEPQAQDETAVLLRIADERLGALCRLLARASAVAPEDAPSLDGLEAELRNAAVRHADSVAADRADYVRKLRLEAAG
jgi:hypothetical protein